MILIGRGLDQDILQVLEHLWMISIESDFRYLFCGMTEWVENNTWSHGVWLVIYEQHDICEWVHDLDCVVWHICDVLCIA